MEVAPNGATFSFITIKYLSMSLHTSLHLISTLALLVLASIAIVFFTPSAHANTAQCVVPITMGMAFGSRDASTGNQVSALQRFLASV